MDTLPLRIDSIWLALRLLMYRYKLFQRSVRMMMMIVNTMLTIFNTKDGKDFCYYPLPSPCQLILPNTPSFTFSLDDCASSSHSFLHGATRSRQLETTSLSSPTVEIIGPSFEGSYGHQYPWESKAHCSWRCSGSNS